MWQAHDCVFGVLGVSEVVGKNKQRMWLNIYWNRYVKNVFMKLERILYGPNINQWEPDQGLRWKQIESALI